MAGETGAGRPNPEELGLDPEDLGTEDLLSGRKIEKDEVSRIQDRLRRAELAVAKIRQTDLLLPEDASWVQEIDRLIAETNSCLANPDKPDYKDQAVAAEQSVNDIAPLLVTRRIRALEAYFKAKHPRKAATNINALERNFNPFWAAAEVIDYYQNAVKPTQEKLRESIPDVNIPNQPDFSWSAWTDYAINQGGTVAPASRKPSLAARAKQAAQAAAGRVRGRQQRGQGQPASASNTTPPNNEGTDWDKLKNQLGTGSAANAGTGAPGQGEASPAPGGVTGSEPAAEPTGSTPEAAPAPPEDEDLEKKLETNEALAAREKARGVLGRYRRFTMPGWYIVQMTDDQLKSVKIDEAVAYFEELEETKITDSARVEAKTKEYEQPLIAIEDDLSERTYQQIEEKIDEAIDGMYNGWNIIKRTAEEDRLIGLHDDARKTIGRLELARHDSALWADLYRELVTLNYEVEDILVEQDTARQGKEPAEDEDDWRQKLRERIFGSSAQNVEPAAATTGSTQPQPGTQPSPSPAAGGAGVGGQPPAGPPTGDGGTSGAPTGDEPADGESGESPEPTQPDNPENNPDDPETPAGQQQRQRRQRARRGLRGALGDLGDRVGAWFMDRIPGWPRRDREQNQEGRPSRRRRNNEGREATQNRTEVEPVDLSVERIRQAMARRYRDESGLSSDEQARRDILTDEEIIKVIEDKGQTEHDRVARLAIADLVLDKQIAETEKAKDERLKQLKDRGLWWKIPTFLGTSFAGTWARHFCQNTFFGAALERAITHGGTQAAQLEAARWLSALSGAIPGLLIGGAMGAYRARKATEKELYNAEKLIKDIKSGKIEVGSEEWRVRELQGAELIRLLLKDKKLHGTKEQLNNAFAYFADQREREMRIEIDQAVTRIGEAQGGVEKFNALEHEERLRLAATEMAAVLERRAGPDGIEGRRTENIQAIRQSFNKEIQHKTAWGALKGGAMGAAVGAGFGWFFPAAGLVTRLNTEMMSQTSAVTKFIYGTGEMAREVTDRLGQKITKQTMEGAVDRLNALALNPDAGQAILKRTAKELAAGANIRDLLHALKVGGPGAQELAVQIGQNLHIDMHHTAGGPELLDRCREYAEFVAKEKINDENAVRGLHHLLSHSNAIGNNFQDFLAVVREAKTAGSREFTEFVIHGGAKGWLTPYVNHWPLTSGGKLGVAMAESMQDYVGHGFTHGVEAAQTLTPLKNVHWMGYETPYMFGFVPLEATMVSAKARLAELFRKKEVAEAAKAGRQEAERAESGEQESVETGPETQNLHFSKDVFNKAKREGTKDAPGGNQELKDQMAGLRAKIPEMHGYFFFKKGADGKLKAYRLWPYRGKDAKMHQKVKGRIHKGWLHNRLTTSTARTGPMDGGEFYVQEFDASRLYNEAGGNFAPIRDQRGLKENWQPNDWPPLRDTTTPKKAEDLFDFDAAGTASPLIVHPTEAAEYAYLFDKGKLPLHEKIGSKRELDEAVGKGQERLTDPSQLTDGTCLKDQDGNIIRVKPHSTGTGKTAEKYNPATNAFEPVAGEPVLNFDDVKGQAIVPDPTTAAPSTSAPATPSSATGAATGPDTAAPDAGADTTTPDASSATGAPDDTATAGAGAAGPSAATGGAPTGTSGAAPTGTGAAPTDTTAAPDAGTAAPDSATAAPDNATAAPADSGTSSPDATTTSPSPAPGPEADPSLAEDQLTGSDPAKDGTIGDKTGGSPADAAIGSAANPIEPAGGAGPEVQPAANQREAMYPAEKFEPFNDFSQIDVGTALKAEEVGERTSKVYKVVSKEDDDEWLAHPVKEDGTLDTNVEQIINKLDVERGDYKIARS